MTPATTEIPRRDWRTYFDNFSRHLPALEATVEVDGRDLGAQVIAENMLLTGLTYDDRDDVFVIGLAREGQEVMEHLVERPQQIMVAAIDILESVDVRDAEERQTIVSLRPAPELPADADADAG
ncbi:MAG TPA: DUF5335 family protein [Solirubrobacteraceae bacterium]|jgi:hypothetical protein|nr:DUF5335 family protein [Solirubrobacteraceae bacterium]